MAKKKAARSEEPDLTVTATVNVYVKEGGEAFVELTVHSDGHEALVDCIKRNNAVVNAAGHVLYGVVVKSIGVEQVGDRVDMLAAGRTGRA